MDMNMNMDVMIDQSVSRSDVEDEPTAALDLRIVDYLYGEFENRSMFESWDLFGIICGVKKIVDTCDHTCICIAVANTTSAVDGGIKRCVKVVQDPNPAGLIDSLNSGKHARSQSSSRRAGRATDGWRIMAYLMLDKRQVDEETITDIVRMCKSRRQLCDRIIVLINMAVHHRQALRVNPDVIMRNSEWFMYTVAQRLSEIPQFVDRIMSHRQQDDSLLHLD
jgi:hypothetical protein